MKYDFTTNQYVYTRVNGSEYRYEDEFPSIVQNFWTNDPVIWDLEKKITWDELAPSLQELIIRKLKFSDLGTVLQNRILTIESNIVNLDNRLTIEINDRRRGDELLQNQIDSLKRRMSSAESRLTVLENRMDEAERQIELLWIEVRKLWQEIWDIWGSDGKNTDHDITHIWVEIRDIWNHVHTLETEVSNLWGKMGSVEKDLDDTKKGVEEIKAKMNPYIVGNYDRQVDRPSPLGSLPLDRTGYLGEFDDTYHAYRVPYNGKIGFLDNRYNSSGRVYKVHDADNIPGYGGNDWFSDQNHSGHFEYVLTALNSMDYNLPYNSIPKVDCQVGDIFLMHTQHGYFIIWSDEIP